MQMPILLNSPPWRGLLKTLRCNRHIKQPEQCQKNACYEHICNTSPMNTDYSIDVEWILEFSIAQQQDVTQTFLKFPRSIIVNRYVPSAVTLKGLIVA